MLLSKACIYGVRASLYMSLVYSEGSFVSIKEMAGKLNISFHFLTKILQQITHAGIMHSYKGPNGGIALSKHPEKITIMEVVQAVDGNGLFEECLLGLPGCGAKKPCPMHEKWGDAREKIKFMFENTTLREMSNKSIDFDLRLSDEFQVRDLVNH